MEYVEVQVQEVSQGTGVKMLLGKMKVRDVVTITDVDKWAEEQLDAYQREAYPERCREIARYIEMQSPLTVFPSSIVISLREGAEFAPQGDGQGTLRIPRTDQAGWVADGQHRVGGFRELVRAQKSPLEVEGPAPEVVAKALEMELPVTFLYLVGEDPDRARGIERAIFWLMNKTAKPIRPSLTDYLQWEIAAKNMFKHPILEKQQPRIQATPLALHLHRDSDSPLRTRINVGGIRGGRGLGRWVQLNSFVSALDRKLMRNDHFNKMSEDMQASFLKGFWQIMAELHPAAFAEATWRDYYILKTISIHALMQLANDVFELCRAGKPQPAAEDVAVEKVRPILKPLGNFDFTKDRCPFRAFGGQQGVAAAYELLKNHLADACTIEAT